MTAFLLVVFDGLRPDMIAADVTPNLLRFAAMGTRLPFARSVFPSETRVCSASVTTGCHPRRHGLVANRIAHPLRAGSSVDTGNDAALRAFQDELGAPLLEVPTLGDRLAAAGRSFCVMSSGSTGQSFVLNPNADAHGQVTVSAHGPAHCSQAGRAVFARLPSPGHGPVERAQWIAEAYRTALLPAPPDATILWLCEPDTTAHYGGLNSPAQRAALRAADAAFGRILDDWQAGPQRERLQIAVASDHGHTTVTGHCDVGAALAALPAFAGCTLLPGSSGGIVVPGPDPDRIAEIATWLTRQPWCGAVLAGDAIDAAPGVLPCTAALVDHRRTAQVLFTLRNAACARPDGLTYPGVPGTSLYDGALALGAGTHGGLSRPEMRTVLMLAGSQIRRGWISDWPAGLPDIAPTALALLGIDGAQTMDGRVLSEAFGDGSAPTESRMPETWEAHAGDDDGSSYGQVLARMRLGRHIWIDGAERHGA